MAALFTTTTVPLSLPFAPDCKTNVYTILTGQVIPAGTPVGVVTASGKLVASASGASDGSQNPIGITPIAYDTSATGTNADANYDIIVEAAEVDFSLLNVTGLTWTAATLRNALRPFNIHVKTFGNLKGAD